MTKKIFIIIFIFAGIFVTAAGAFVVYEYPFRFGYAPEQPINFSHKIHAGENKIPCQYCHLYARRSIVAGVPSVQTCWNCHKLISKDMPEIQKIAEYWKRKEPIPWIKVYDLPDFVHFSHKRHIAKEIRCQHCHGDIETMDRVERIAFLNMGFCVKCHRENGAEDDCWTCHK